MKPAPPERLLALVNLCEGTARRILEEQGGLSAMAFIGSEGAFGIMPVGHLPKNAVKPIVHKIAREQDADFVLMVMECWALDERYADQLEQLRARYGQLSDMPAPYVYEAVSFGLDTHDGTWMGIAKIFQRPDGAKSFEHVALTMFGLSEGRMVGMLPPRSTRQ